MDLHPEIADLLRQIEVNSENAKKLTADLSNDQFCWRPAPEAWSISECMVHLNMANGKELPSFARAIEEAQQKGRFNAGPYRYGWFSRWFVRNLDAPAKRKFKAPAIFVPPADQKLEVVLPEYLKQQERLAQLIRRANGLDLGKIKIASTVIKWLRFPLGMRFALIPAHDRRHLAQAWRVREQLPKHLQ